MSKIITTKHPKQGIYCDPSTEILDKGGGRRGAKPPTIKLISRGYYFLDHNRFSKPYYLSNMVKNSTGGCKQKGMARKDLNSSLSSRDYVPQNEAEHFAQVTRLLGNGMCHVQILLHDKSLLSDIVCHIRGKFRAKNKRHNTIIVGSFVVVGLRTWETSTKNCDLLAISNHTSSLITSAFNLSQTPYIHDSIHFNDYIQPPSHTITETKPPDELTPEQPDPFHDI